MNGQMLGAKPLYVNVSQRKEVRRVSPPLVWASVLDPPPAHRCRLCVWLSFVSNASDRSDELCAWVGRNPDLFLPCLLCLVHGELGSWWPSVIAIVLHLLFLVKNTIKTRRIY
jgi:hypothetical protein